jgi:hypothetical protein
VGDLPGTLIHPPSPLLPPPNDNDNALWLWPTGAPFAALLHAASHVNVPSCFKSPTTNCHRPPYSHYPAHQNPTATDTSLMTNTPHRQPTTPTAMMKNHDPHPCTHSALPSYEAMLTLPHTATISPITCTAQTLAAMGVRLACIVMW